MCIAALVCVSHNVNNSRKGPGKIQLGMISQMPTSPESFVQNYFREKDVFISGFIYRSLLIITKSSAVAVKNVTGYYLER